MGESTDGELDSIWKDQADVKESSSEPGVEEGSWWAVPPLGPSRWKVSSSSTPVLHVTD